MLGGLVPAAMVVLAITTGPVQAAVPPAPGPKPPMAGVEEGVPQDLPPGTVLAKMGVYELTKADADAYVDALVFCLSQAGQDPNRLAADRAVVQEYLVNSFATLPEAAQIDLADMTGIWDRAREQWQNLAAMEKNAFSYGVLALAFGEEDASRILRWNPRGAMVEGTPPPPAPPSLSESSDIDCIMTGICGGSGVRLPE